MSIFNQNVSLNAGNLFYPAGTILLWTGATPPIGWLLCNGATYSKTDYPKLFSAIGTLYGEGSAEGSFKVPDITNRYIAGASTTSGHTISSTLTATSSTASHTLTVSQIPAHNHQVTDPGHKHTYSKCIIEHNQAWYNQTYWNPTYNTTDTSTVKTGITVGYKGGDGGHTHTISNFRPASLALNYIIKY